MQEQGCQQCWAFDEGRFGLKVWFQRRWCPRGVRPRWVVEDAYEWRWLYAAVEPTSGQSVFLLLPGVDRVCLQVFLDTLRHQTGTARIGVVLDGSGAHTAKDRVWPEGIVPLPLPPYSPELNPAEHIFQHLRSRLANQIFADLAALEEAIIAVLREFWDDPTILQHLTGFDWWLAAFDEVDAIRTPAA